MEDQSATQEYAITQLQKLLKETVVELRFKKVDGTVRNMICTLRTDLLPVLPPPDPDKPVKERKESELTLRVFDLEKKEFRSFRKDGLIDYKVYVPTPTEIKNDTHNL